MQAVRLRRAELRETLFALEAALASPASGRDVVWGEHVHAASQSLAQDVRTHVDVTEGAGGLHQSILAGDLRLANAVSALTREHAVITGHVAGVVADSAAPVTAADVSGLRERATALIAELARHRQRGADLVYEAFAVDLGGGD